MQAKKRQEFSDGRHESPKDSDAYENVPTGSDKLFNAVHPVALLVASRLKISPASGSDEAGHDGHYVCVRCAKATLQHGVPVMKFVFPDAFIMEHFQPSTLEIAAMDARFARKTALADMLWHDLLQNNPRRDVAAWRCARASGDREAADYYEWLMINHRKSHGKKGIPANCVPPMPLRETLWPGDDIAVDKAANTKSMPADKQSRSLIPPTVRRRVRYSRLLE